LFILIIILINIFFLKNFKYKNEIQEFECGVLNNILNRPSISVQFYLICVIFIIFDVEIVILVFFIKINRILENFMLIGFLFFILLTFILEKYKNTITWVK